MRIFAGDRVKAIMDRLKMPGRGDRGRHRHPLDRGAQRKVGRATSTCASDCSSDDVANDQRKVIYQQRNELLEQTGSPSSSPTCAVALTRGAHLRAGRASRGAVGHRRSRRCCARVAARDRPEGPGRASHELDDADIVEGGRRRRCVPRRQDRAGRRGQFNNFGRMVLLQSIDSHWREHLAALDYLRQGIHLRGYAQKNPKQEYKRRGLRALQPVCSMW